MNKSPCLGEENFSAIAKHLLIQRRHQSDRNLAGQQELRLEASEYTKMNRVENTASHTGLFLTVPRESNRSGLWESPSHKDVRGTVKGAGAQPQRQQTANCVCLSSSLSLSHIQRGRLPGCAAFSLQARPRSRSWKNTRELAGGWTRAFL